MPRLPVDIHPILRQMQRRGDIVPIPGTSHVYAVTVPYARADAVDEAEVLFEAHPYAALAYLTALTFHGLTDQLPKDVAAVVPTDGTGDLLPLDTDASDWDGLPLVRGRRPTRVLDRPVVWTVLRPGLFFGLREYRPRGYPVRATTPERTLLDGLLHPERCGGLTNVLGAWSRARGVIDVEALVSHTERFGIALLRQRVGFVLDQLGITHPQVEKWRSGVQRGGSSKLLSAAPYAPTFDERWALSLNAPIDALRGDYG